MSSRSPFTATQWQELEHQALIFKYMVSGVPIPPELIYSVKRSLDSSLASRLFPHQPIGWGCFQVGFGRKPDPEPGRYFHGIKEGVVHDERDFFPEASGSVRSITHHHDHSCQPLMTNSFKGYSHDHQSQFQQQQEEQHCFVLGTDFKSSAAAARPLKTEKEDHHHHDETDQKPLHHFFGEWPPKNTDSWLDLASNSRVHNW
ncbi:hypothetical protein JRO89_XS09G0227500 [Xanthoceras sorbifolium]|uniref:Growth-regulating factor n=1 Tax=Xanthoceras sorbifolium TaxID=99658 RepID=A0ABQ8HMI6_9ROSI|nr:hypothetical protein JRO89_XS09G0227500 [Xanthoceras sorbifolium]